jgi:hypothetical protein
LAFFELRGLPGILDFGIGHNLFLWFQNNDLALATNAIRAL